MSCLMKNRFIVMRGSDAAPLAWRRTVQFCITPLSDPEAVIRVLERSVLDTEISHVLTQPPPSAIFNDVAAGRTADDQGKRQLAGRRAISANLR